MASLCEWPAAGGRPAPAAPSDAAPRSAEQEDGRQGEGALERRSREPGAGAEGSPVVAAGTSGGTGGSGWETSSAMAAAWTWQ